VLRRSSVSFQLDFASVHLGYQRSFLERSGQDPWESAVLNETTLLEVEFGPRNLFSFPTVV
jgi:hypothetical protein